MKYGQDTRVAVALSQTPTSFYAGNPALGQAVNSSTASNMLLGVTHKLNESWTGGVSVGQLSEKSGILGASYQENSVLSLGANHTTSLGLSLGYSFNAYNSLLAEAGFGFTKAASGGGLLAGTTDIQSRSYGMTFLSKHLITKDDTLAISVKQPLRIVSGKVGVITTGIDDAGVALYSTEMTSLVPTGHERDFKMAYDTPLKKNQSLSLQLSARQDVMNVAGSRDASVGAIWSSRF